MLELNVSRDGEVLVPGAQEAYENAYREEARVREVLFPYVESLMSA